MVPVMMMTLRSIVASFIIALALSSGAEAQSLCNGQVPAGRICGNPGGSQATPGAFPTTQYLDQALGSTPGLIAIRGPSSWQGTTALPNGTTATTQPTSDNSTNVATTAFVKSSAFSTPVLLVNGGTGASLTASNGGIVYSAASALAILGGTGVAGQCLLSGSNAAPSWGSCTGTAAVSSVGNAISDTTLSLTGTGSGPYTGAVSAALNLGNANIWTGAQTFTNGDFLLKGSSSGAMTLEAPAVASNFVMTFPAATDTVSVLGTAQTFTAAKTFTNNDLKLLGSSTGATTFASANSGASNFTMTIPAVTSTVAVLGLSQTFTATETFNGSIVGPDAGNWTSSGIAASTLALGGAPISFYTLAVNGLVGVGQGTGTPSMTLNGGASGAGGGAFYQIDLNGNFNLGLGNVSGLEGGSFNNNTIFGFGNDLFLSTGTPGISRTDIIHLTSGGTTIVLNSLQLLGLSGGTPSKYLCLDASNNVVSSVPAC